MTPDHATTPPRDRSAQLVEDLSVALSDARMMLEHSQDGIMVVDDERRYLAMNRAAAELLERASHEVLGRTVDEVFALGGSERVALDTAWDLLMADGKLRIDWPLVLPSGAEIVLDLAATASFRPGRHLKVMRDVTAIRRDQAALADREQRLQFLLEEIERMRDTDRRRMAGDIHDHSLQHLIAARMTLDVGASLEGTARDEMHTRAGDLLDEAIVATRRLLQNLAPLHTEHRPLGESLTIVLQELGELYATPIVIDLDLPLQITEGRRLVISRIVTEAAVNACRHAAASEIRVWGRVDADGVATVSVSDDGCGFDASSDAPVPDGGLGVGMLLMRERVRAMNGEIDVRTTAGEGTTVTLRVPQVSPEPGARGR